MQSDAFVWEACNVQLLLRCRLNYLVSAKPSASLLKTGNAAPSAHLPFEWGTEHPLSHRIQKSSKKVFKKTDHEMTTMRKNTLLMSGYRPVFMRTPYCAEMGRGVSSYGAAIITWSCPDVHTRRCESCSRRYARRTAMTSCPR